MKPRRQTRAGQANATGKQHDSNRFAKEQRRHYVVGPRANLREWDARIRESKQKQDQLNWRCPPALQPVQRVRLSVLARLKHPEVTTAVRHQWHDWYQRQGWMEPALI